MSGNSEFDMFVVGGGPAGLAAAIAARKYGLSVAVADAACPPIDKACGEGIMPAGVSVLHSLGIDIAVEQCAPFRGIKFVDQSGEVSALFPGVPGYGVRRTTLHRLLAAEARRCGVELLWLSRVTSIFGNSITVDSSDVRAKFIVLADGQRTSLRRAAGFPEPKVISKRFGLRQHYRVTPWSDLVEVHWSDLGQMYVTPVSSGEVEIALLTSNKSVKFEDALTHFPAVAEKVRGREASSRLMGAVTSARRFSTVVRGNVVLTGDASGSADAITGDGLSLAFEEATVLAHALASGDLMAYQREHPRILRRPLAMGRLLLLMDSRPSLRRSVFGLLRTYPSLFDLLLKVHIGENLFSGAAEESRRIAA